MNNKFFTWGMALGITNALLINLPFLKYRTLIPNSILGIIGVIFLIYFLIIRNKEEE